MYYDMFTFTNIGGMYDVMSQWYNGDISGLFAAGLLGANAFGGKLGGLAFKESYSVYHGLNHLGNVKYVGITKRDPAIRFAEHARATDGKAYLRYRVIDGATGLTRSEARVMEQQLINQYGLDNLYNKINSISPSKWHLYDGL